jgi:outer membrane receptor protein involved in Fe transport
LGSIPVAALERIEILRDGASSTYGTDAIGGVINFILRRNYEGGEASLGTDITQEGGGNIYKVSGLFGFGSLDKDRFNAMLSLSASKNERLSSRQRDFAGNGHDPANGVAQETVGTPFASQIATTNASNWTALGHANCECCKTCPSAGPEAQRPSVSTRPTFWPCRATAIPSRTWRAMPTR